MKQKLKCFLGIFLSLALVLSLMPCMSLTVYADTTKAYADYDVTTDANKTKSGDALEALQVTFNGKKWYIIEDNSTAVNAGTVTLLAAESFGTSAFGSDYHYNSSTVKGYLDSIVAGTAGDGKPNFSGVANAIKPVTLETYNYNSATVETTENAKLYLLDKADLPNLQVPTDVRKFSTNWWLRTPGNPDRVAYFSTDGTTMYGGGAPVSNTYGVRPALKLDLSAVHFSSGTNTFTVKPYAAYNVTTYANKNKSGDALTALQVTFKGEQWYIIEDNSDSTTEPSVTLLAEHMNFGISEFDDSSNAYSTSTIKDKLDEMTAASNGSFYGVRNAIKTVEVKGSDSDTPVAAKLYLLSVDEANDVPQNVLKFGSWWWLRSPVDGSDHAETISASGDTQGGGLDVSLNYGGIRPALKLDLSAVTFDSGSKTFSCITSLGTGAIINPTQPNLASDSWKGNYVYYGKYGGTPTKYRVLDKASSDFGVTGNSLLLDCDNVLYEAKFDEDGSPNSGAQKANQWAYSDIKNGLNGDSFLTKAGNFTAVESSAIAESIKAAALLGDGNGWEDLDYAPLSGEKIFLLDAKEATRTSYGYLNTIYLADSRKKTGNKSWWLRSPRLLYDDYDGMVYDENNYDTDGMVSYDLVTSTMGVSPAFNISLPSIIFSSLISGTSGSEGAAYKLTLKDPNLSIVAGAEDKGNNKYLVSYDITDNSSSAAPTQVSVVVTDKAWTENGWREETNLLQYTKLEMTTFALSGTGTFTLDGSITGALGTNYHLYVLAEDKKEGNETNFASKPLEIKKIPSYLYSLKYDHGDGGTGSMASEKVSTDYEFTFPECGFTAPEGKSFYHWKMSGEDGIYYPNGTVIIADNCAQGGVVTVTAHWKSQPAAKATTLPTAKTLTYTGSPQALVNSGVAEDGTMKYVLGENATTAPTSGWDTAIPEGTEAKTYYVWYKVFGDDTHSDTTPVPLTVTIKKKSSGSGSSPGPSYTYYTVKFEMNGHGEQVSSQTVRSGSKAKRPQDPTAEEYYFAGWFEDAGLTKEYDFSSPVRKSMTLYARWEEIRFTVSFDLDGKGSIETQWVRKNGMAEKPDDPSAEGYTFDGWYLDSDCKTPYDFSTPVTKDITVYAKWVRDVSIYRLYNPNSGAHLFTSNGAEKDNLVLIGWEYEGVAWTAPASSNTPVYRVYNPNSGEHHYTMNAAEKDILVALGWNDEGICWYSDEKQGTPLYRLYNPNATGQYAAGAHHYTKDIEEREYLIAAGWNDEGIGWYGL